MNGNQRKRFCDESSGDGSPSDGRPADDFVVEIRHGLLEVGNREGPRVSPSDEDRQDFPGSDIQEMDTGPGYLVEDLINQIVALLRNVPLGQRARVHVKRIGHAYSSRISMMPLLNALDSGSNPS